MLIRQQRYDEAMALLDRAREQHGDRIELRLARLRLASTQGGPQTGPILDELSRGIESFKPDERLRLLTALALERSRRRDPEAAAAWKQLADVEPQSLQPPLNLFDLAIQVGDAELAEQRVRDVAKIDDQFGELCRAQLLAWKARNAKDADARSRFRSEARSILVNLKAHRPDWAKVPLALAELDREEFAELGNNRDKAPEKLESMIASYRRAIELGQRDPALVRLYIGLLFQAGRGEEALEFYGRMPAGTQITGDLGRVATQLALANRDYQQAEEIARKAVEASPGDFQARVWLSQVLIDRRNFDEAEKVIRGGLEADKADPERWITLVRFLVMTRQGAKAEQAVRDAEAPLADKPLALARCCGLVGKSLELAEPDRAKMWYAQALAWFDKARAALKDADDLSVDRKLAEFLLATDRSADAEAPLKKILARTADGKSPTLAAWRGAAWRSSTSSPTRPGSPRLWPSTPPAPPRAPTPRTSGSSPRSTRPRGLRRGAARPSPTSGR